MSPIAAHVPVWMWAGCAGSAVAAGVASCARAGDAPSASRAKTTKTAVQTDGRTGANLMSTLLQGCPDSQAVLRTRNEPEAEVGVSPCRTPLNRKGLAS